MNKDLRYIENMIQAAQTALDILKKHPNDTIDDFYANPEFNNSTAMLVGQIGEQLKSNKLSKEIQATRSEINWSEIAGMRQVLYHDYFDIDYDLLWDVLNNQLPEILEQLKKLKKDLWEELE